MCAYIVVYRCVPITSHNCSMLCSNEIVVMYVLVVLLVYIHFLSVIMGMYCHTDNGKRNYASLDVCQISCLY